MEPPHVGCYTRGRRPPGVFDTKGPEGILAVRNELFLHRQNAVAPQEGVHLRLGRSDVLDGNDEELQLHAPVYDLSQFTKNRSLRELGLPGSAPLRLSGQARSARSCY